MEFINTRTSARPYRQLEEEYTLTFMSATPDGAAMPERKLWDRRTEFAAHSDSLAYRTIGIYVFPRTVMCSPVRASQIAHALKLPRVSVVRRLEELIEHGYVERVGNAYRLTDKVNIPELQKKLQRRIDMVAETAKRLAELNAGAQ
jgi:hypothetical protein